MSIIDTYAERYIVPRADIEQWCDDMNASLASGDRTRVLGDGERFKSIGLRYPCLQIDDLCHARSEEVGR